MRQSAPLSGNTYNDITLQFMPAMPKYGWRMTTTGFVSKCVDHWPI